MYGYHDHHGDWAWGGWLVMSLVMLLFLAVVAVGMYLIWRTAAGTGPAPGSAGSRAPERPAQEILAERLARGEIDPEEYRTRLSALRDGDAGA